MNLKRQKLRIAASLLVMLFIIPHQVAAQGSVYGKVQRSDMSFSPDEAVRFFGFVAGTDNEIRINGSAGNGFDGGNWYDDFQNFLYAPSSVDYSYYFFDTLAGQFGLLQAIIPNNSFQQEDILLSSVAWPDPPASVSCLRLADSTVLLSWSIAEGSEVHLYRRAGSSGGSFYRLDDPSGNLNSGVGGTSYVDSSAAGSGSYSYLLLALDQLGRFSLPTDIIEATALCCGLYVEGFTGDVTDDTEGKRNLADITRLIDRVYISKNPLWCEPSGNVSGDSLGQMNLVDITRLIDHVYSSKDQTAPCQ